jgi:hypothetical protein
MATAMREDGGSDSGWNRVSGGSGGDSGYGSGRQQQKLRGQATINKMWQAALVAAETAAVAAAIDAAQLQRQAGTRGGGSDNDESSGNSNKYPLLPLAMVRDHCHFPLPPINNN